MSEPPTGTQLQTLATLHRLADRKFQQFLMIAPTDPAYELSWNAYQKANQYYWQFSQYLHKGAANAGHYH